MRRAGSASQVLRATRHCAILYRQAWLVASASIAEGWGLNADRGAACGTPAVATDVGGHRCSVVDGSTGVLAQTNQLGEEIAGVAARWISGARRWQPPGLVRLCRLTWDATAAGLLTVLHRDAERRLHHAVRSSGRTREPLGSIWRRGGRGCRGRGYVGLTTAACLAHLGHDVVCADVDPEKSNASRAGVRSPSSRLATETLVADENRRAGRTALRAGAARADSVALTLEFIDLCVPDATGRRRLGRPAAPRGGSSRAGPRQAHSNTKRRHRERSPPFPSARPRSRLGCCSTAARTCTSSANPEFLREGHARWRTSSIPIACVVGSRRSRARHRRSPRSTWGLQRRSSSLIRPSAERSSTSPTCSSATKLSFVNSVATLSEHLGADVDDVILAPRRRPSHRPSAS